MQPFPGFPEGKSHLIPIPEQFFTELLPLITDVAEMRLILYVFWRLEQMEGIFRYLRLADFLEDQAFLDSIATPPNQAQDNLDQALEDAVLHGALLRADLPSRNGLEPVYFLNSPKGRAALRAIQSNQWRPGAEAPTSLVSEPPNIFRLYEENIGPLTPLIADTLSEAEDTYPIEWIADAIRIAVEKNKRAWRYIAAILERWQQEGRDARKAKTQDRRDTPETRRRYIEGEFSDFVEH